VYLNAKHLVMQLDIHSLKLHFHIKYVYKNTLHLTYKILFKAEYI
jgi:hypothetical protein